MVYYNDNDPKSCQWLRELIKAGHLPWGYVDCRSIKEVDGGELGKYRQCHFFAGIGGWALALRLAGWPADRPVWTGSCPCQPFSAAGKGGGTDDPRHLWPDFRRIISEGNPAVVFGEQVASKAGRLWLTGVRSEMEALGYGFGGADLCAAGLGTPHIRQRLWWVADGQGKCQTAGYGEPERSELVICEPGDDGGSGVHGAAGGVENPKPHGRRRRSNGDTPGRPGPVQTEGSNTPGDGVGDALKQGLEGHLGNESGGGEPGRVEESEGGSASQTSSGSGMADTQSDNGGSGECRTQAGAGPDAERRGRPPGGRHCAWADCIYIPCADGKARPIKPGLAPLVDGLPGRVGLLRGYGNAIVPQVAAEFIQAYMEVE